jgi:BirA family biotin operon repressor/biotin-[acetyl-CoA-carboxylase] ligase
MLSPGIDIDRILSGTFVSRMEYHPALGSTNDRARQCAAEAIGPLPLLIVADEQTAGRGRGSNRWWTGPGSLAMTLLLEADPRPAEPGVLSLLGLAAAVAVVETVAPLLPDHQIGLHWPNDVFAAGRKLAGVLVEVLADRRRIVGIGLNTNNTLADAPPELRGSITTLRELSGVPHDPTAILLTLLGHFEQALRQLADSPEELAARADRCCLLRGRLLAIRTGKSIVRGRCEGIGRDGELLLETSGGVRKFHSGTLALE